MWLKKKLDEEQNQLVDKIINKLEGTCSSCIFYRDGFCKRNPPQVVVVHSDSDPGEWCNKGIFWEVQTRWPVPSEDAWCGEYEHA